jgi:DNA-binding transcriptional ArsR family regulator
VDEIGVLGSETRVAIVKVLAEGSSTPTDIAERIGKSLPVVTRHLSQLQRAGLVERVGERKGKTRPSVEYALRESILLFKALRGGIDFIRLQATELVKTQVRIWSIPQREFHYYVQRFFWEIQEAIPSIESIAVYGSVAKGDAREDSDVDILIIARSDVRELERRYGARVIEKPGSEAKMFMTQVFEPAEFRKSLKSGSDFARRVMEAMVIIYDPNRFLGDLEVGALG